MMKQDLPMREMVKYAADVITTANFYKNKGASVRWYIIQMTEGDPRGEDAEQELRIMLHELGFLTNANSRLDSLHWNVNPI